MPKTLIACLLITVFTACDNKHSEKTYEDRGQALVDKILSDSLTFEQVNDLINKSSVLDSLSFDQKKVFVMKLAQSSGWEIDDVYSEHQFDSIVRNTDIREYVKLLWRPKDHSNN